MREKTREPAAGAAAAALPSVTPSGGRRVGVVTRGDAADAGPWRRCRVGGGVERLGHGAPGEKLNPDVGPRGTGLVEMHELREIEERGRV